MLGDVAIIKRGWKIWWVGIEKLVYFKRPSDGEEEKIVCVRVKFDGRRQQRGEL
jgi:hypothetical protein